MSDQAITKRSAITLREGHFASFFNVPFLVYGDRYPFVSPLKSDLKAMLDFERNPFFKGGVGRIYTAMRDGRPVGRIAAHMHARYIERYGVREAAFGFFDCVNDVDVARALLGAAEGFARAHKCTLIRGNMNLTANQEIGVMTSGEEHRPFLAQIYNPNYIGELLEACGYEATHPMSSFVQDDVQSFDVEPMLGDKHRALMQDKEYTFRPFDTKRFKEEVEAIRQVLNAAMDGNYLFVPMSEEEAQFQLGPLKLVMDPSLLQFAEHNGVPVGVTMCVPDVVPMLQEMRSRIFPTGWWTFLTKRKKLKGATIIIILTRPEYQSKGLTRVLFYLLFKALKEGGYTSVGGTWIGDDNTASLKSAEAIGMKPYHRIHMFEKELT